MENVKKTKLTEKDLFKGLADVVLAANLTKEEEDRYLQFIDRKLTLLANKRKSETKTQKENKVIAEKVYEVIAAAEEPITIDDILANEIIAEIKVVDKNGEEKELSKQKVSALITQLKKAGRVERIEIKKKAYYKAI